MFSHVWGVMAPKASLVDCLGRLGLQNRAIMFPKGSLLMSRTDICSIKKRHPERDGSQIAFSLCCVCFLEGPTLDPLAPAQSKRSCSFSAWPLKNYRFCNNYRDISGTIGVGIP